MKTVSENKKNNINPEAVIVKLARMGKLSLIGKLAIQANHKLGLATTLLEDSGIYRVYPDGTKKLIKAFAKKSYPYTTGKIFIK